MDKSMRRQLLVYLNGKLFEWSFSWCLILLGTAMVIFPRMIRGSILTTIVKILEALHIDTIVVPLAFLVIGTLGIAALIANGQSMWMGPWTRAICALLRGVIWITFTLSMVEVSFKQGFPSPMDFFFFVFALTEFFIMYRAVLDVKNV